MEEIALILGWEKRKVEQIVFRYVTGDAVAQGIAERLRQNKASTEAVNQGVNRASPEAAETS